MYLLSPNNFQKIDIVYTYVNNTDKTWLLKYSKYFSQIDSSRFNFNGEIFFSLKTVQKFFNWVNKIYIVHDNQEFNLNFLEKDFSKKIKFIDHTEIIPSEYLPVFNSGVIECFLWKIKGLSDYYIYLNDDIFFGNYIYYSDFFTNFNAFKDFSDKRNSYFEKDKLNELKYLISRDSSERIFNEKYNTNYHIYLSHTPYNFNKHVCKYTFRIFYKYLKKTFNLKVRTYNNVNIDYKERNYYSFITLCTLMQHHFKISMSTKINKLTIWKKLDEEQYKQLFRLKPKIFNINDLSNDQLIIWNNIQNNYLKSFDINNKYSQFIKKLNKMNN